MQFSTLFSLSVAALAMTSLLTEVQAAPVAAIKRSTPLLPKCDIACTMEYAPICAVSTKNGQHSNTFGNKCALSVFNCENPDNTFRAVSENACDGDAALEKRSTPLLPKCNIACTKEFAPICTNPDNTFRAAPETACEPNPALVKRSTPLLPKCNIACTKEFAPICTVSTKNAQHSQTFNNKCLLNVFNCENPDNTFRAAPETACEPNPALVKRSTPLLPKCNIACTKEYAPICTVSTKNAQHSQTFNNKCLLNVFNCENPDNTFRAAPETACEPNPALVKRSTPLLPKCNIACTKEYAPICTVSTKNAQHSQTFNNKCLLNVFNCENPDNTFRAAPETACEPNPALEKRSTPLLPKCNIACTKEFAPICTVSTKNAQHSQIFNSKCLLNVFNCENPDNTFRVAPQDVCSLV
ncbi:hypothetical protein EC991_010235 [Linnemannia zychae]|nr:hypothetical protein EC991_010235 [Linnemannia zychae]